MKINIKTPKKKSMWPKKVKVILVFQDGTVIDGDGSVEAIKDSAGRALFSALLVKEIPKK